MFRDPICLQFLLVIIFNLCIYDNELRQKEQSCPTGQLFRHQGICQTAPRQFKLLTAFPHLALTIQFPANCKVYTESVRGAGNGLNTIVELNAHRVVLVCVSRSWRWSGPASAPLPSSVFELP